MAEMDLRGQVVIVTGAGRGLGREHALALARHGACVVVNDVGAGLDGHGASAAAARGVVAEILAGGGQAVANTDDVSAPWAGTRLVTQALDAFGRLDALVCNAGICRDKPFADTAAEDFEQFYRINFLGHLYPIKAAWEVMLAQNYGRIVLTGSGAGMFGLANETAYAATKGALHGLMRSLAVEGEAHGIKVNTLCPGGVSRMHEEAFPDPAVLAMMRNLMPPALVAPAAVYLASPACSVTGESFSVWGGRVARILVGSGVGYIDRALTPEAIAGNLSQIMAADELFAARDGVDDVAHWQGHILG